MPEYNFWDDRTHEMNESYWCPYIADYCYGQQCGTCEDKISFDEYFDSLDRAEKEKEKSYDL